MVDRYIYELATWILFCNGGIALAQSVSFQAHTDLSLGAGCCAYNAITVAQGDFNGDGKVDLMVTDGTGTLQLLLGDGHGGFQLKTVPGFFPNYPSLIASDINRDGKLDLLIGTAGPGIGQTLLMLGNGDGTFQPAVGAAANSAVLAADFNRDGIPDLLVAPPVGSQGCLFAVQLGNGDGTFRQPVGCNPTTQGDTSYFATVGDFNGDGKLDVVWTNFRGDQYINIWLGNGDGTFQPPSRVDSGQEHDPKPVALADLNHDGKADLVVGGTAAISILLGKGDGTFQPPQVISLPSALWSERWSYGNDIYIADFNGDGVPDIAMDNLVLIGKGDGTFQPPRPFSTGHLVAETAIFCGDLNADGKPDLVLLNTDIFPSGGTQTTGISILLNNSPGSPRSVRGYSAASGGSLLAPSAIGSIYGTNLARSTATIPGGLDLPTHLGGISVQVRDVMGTVRLAPLYYVSPAQINFVLPAGTVFSKAFGDKFGLVTLTIDDGSGPLPESTVATVVANSAAALFTVDAQGTPAATALRVRADGTVTPVPVLDCSGAGTCTLVPIDLSSGEPVYLSLYGTGFRNATVVPGKTNLCHAATGLTPNLPVQYSGAQGTFAGLDQINVLLPKALPSGLVNIQCAFDDGSYVILNAPIAIR